MAVFRKSRELPAEKAGRKTLPSAPGIHQGVTPCPQRFDLHIG